MAGWTSKLPYSASEGGQEGQNDKASDKSPKAWQKMWDVALKEGNGDKGAMRIETLPRLDTADEIIYEADAVLSNLRILIRAYIQSTHEGPSEPRYTRSRGIS